MYIYVIFSSSSYSISLSLIRISRRIGRTYKHEILHVNITYTYTIVCMLWHNINKTHRTKPLNAFECNKLLPTINKYFETASCIFKWPYRYTMRFEDLVLHFCMTYEVSEILCWYFNAFLDFFLKFYISIYWAAKMEKKWYWAKRLGTSC